MVILAVRGRKRNLFTDRNFIVEVNSNGGYKDTTFWYEMGKLFAEMYKLSDNDWDGIRDMIRSSNDADKAKRSV